MTQKNTYFYWALLLVSIVGFSTSYFPGVIGEPILFWVSDLIATLSYFTIISNIAVGVLAATQLFYNQSKVGLALSSMTAQTSIAVYITITGLIYHVLLSDTWEPKGLDLVSDVFMHTITPLLYALFWWFCARGKVFPLKRTLAVLIVPALFVVYWLIRGPIIGEYPYFFLDVFKLGYAIVAINTIGLGLVVWAVAAFYWALSEFTTPLYV
jgi:hypothetical protein